MSILEEILVEEYERSERMKRIYLKKLEELPKGYLSRKKINGSVYAYFQHREGSKIISRYIPNEELEAIEEQIEIRKRYQRRLREVNDDMKKIRKVVGPLVAR